MVLSTLSFGGLSLATTKMSPDSDDDHSDDDGRPEHVCARDEAVSEAFTLIARGGVPRAVPFDDRFTDTAAVERNCVRELVGIIGDWRPPPLHEWRAYPEIDDGVAKKQHNVLITRMAIGSAQVSMSMVPSNPVMASPPSRSNG